VASRHPANRGETTRPHRRAVTTSPRRKAPLCPPYRMERGLAALSTADRARCFGQYQRVTCHAPHAAARHTTTRPP
jgi:hypothetical protein